MQEAKQDLHAALKSRGVIEKELKMAQTALHDATAQMRGQSRKRATIMAAQDCLSENPHMAVSRSD